MSHRDWLANCRINGRHSGGAVESWMNIADCEPQLAAAEHNVAGLAKLARSLAHSINGGLSIACGNLMLLKSQLYDPESLILLDEAMKALTRQGILASGLAAIGGVVGGGMVAGTVTVVAAPAIAAGAVGAGAYFLSRKLRGIKPRKVTPPQAGLEGLPAVPQIES